MSRQSFQQFRREFIIPDKNVLRWFPGHMAGGIKRMQAKLKSVDCVIEVHDARIPLSGRNPNFKYDFLGVKPHILVLNKVDLADGKYKSEVIKYLETKEKIENIVFTDCKRQKSSEGLKELIPKILEAISTTNRRNRMANREYGVLVIGVPNVGKSSLINSLRSKYMNIAGNAPVGAKAGITRAVQNRIRVSQEPPVYIYDTPGILTPFLPNVETGMKLAVCGTTQDALVGMLVIADYLLYWFNKNNHFNYLDFFGITEPCDNLGKLLAEYAVKRNIYLRVKSLEGNSPQMVMKPDLHSAAYFFVEAFRLGNLGPVTLDADILA